MSIRKIRSATRADFCACACCYSLLLRPIHGGTLPPLIALPFAAKPPAHASHIIREENVIYEWIGFQLLARLSSTTGMLAFHPRISRHKTPRTALVLLFVLKCWYCNTVALMASSSLALLLSFSSYCNYVLSFAPRSCPGRRGRHCRHHRLRRESFGRHCVRRSTRRR